MGWRSATAADLVIETLAATEVDLIDEARELASDAHVYAELTHEAIHALRRLTVDLDRANRTIAALREETRRYTRNAVLGLAA